MLFFVYLGSGTKIWKTGTVNSSFFNSLSNETNPTEIGGKLWNYLHFWWDLLFFLSKYFFSFFLQILIGSNFDSFQVRLVSTPETKSQLDRFSGSQDRILRWGGPLTSFFFYICWSESIKILHINSSIWWVLTLCVVWLFCASLVCDNWFQECWLQISSLYAIILDLQLL